MDMEKENKFKKISVVPNESDFVNAIRSLENPARVCSSNYLSKCIKLIRFSYEQKVRSVELSFWNKFTTVLEEFPCESQLHPLYSRLIQKRYNLDHYFGALSEVVIARKMLHEITCNYVRLLKKDGDSLDQCKRLKVAALGCMLTVVKRCIPSLSYLEKVRQCKASLEDDAAAAVLTIKYQPENLPAPLYVYVPNVADLVDPDTSFWLEELKREHGIRVSED